MLWYSLHVYRVTRHREKSVLRITSLGLSFYAQFYSGWYICGTHFQTYCQYVMYTDEGRRVERTKEVNGKQPRYKHEKQFDIKEVTEEVSNYISIVTL